MNRPTFPFLKRAFTLFGWQRNTLDTDCKAVSNALIFICDAARLL